MALAIRLVPLPVKTLAFGSISGTYMGVGTAFDRPIRLILLQNLTDQLVMFSFDGVDDHVPLGASSYVILDVTANKATEGGFYIAEGTRIYVKDNGIATTTGSVFVSSFGGAI